MSDIKRYDYIRMSDADNGVTVSFDIIKKDEGSDKTFEMRHHHSKEFVFTMDKVDEAFAFFRALMMFNITKKKGETVESVHLPS